MASFNRVILLGNITRDFEVKYLQSGTAVTEIGLAVNDKYKNQSGEWVEEVTFVDVTLWGRTAEIAGEYLSKGSPVLIEGRLKLHQWEKDGQKQSKLRVTCDRLQMLPKGGGRGGNQNFDDAGDYGDAPSGPPARGGAEGGPRQRSNQPSAPPPPTADEIPF
jgi:single-strand DNA-binding protein